jgi:uncharacterized damage-inducible protein DinB
MTLPLMRNRACLALAEENETARIAFNDLLPRFPAEAFTTGDVEKEDNVRGILCHVNCASFSYACWIARVLGRLDPAREKEEKAAFFAEVKSLTSASGFEDASRRAAERYYAVLATVTEDELGTAHTTNWGKPMEVESMLEHALVHLMRHRRQLEIHLGLRDPGTIAS